MVKLFTVNMTSGVDEELLKTLHSGYITQGTKVAEFELILSNYLDSEYCISLNSGTSALTLALRLADVGYGDEVITTPMTCTATNLPILSLGAIPVFADIDEVTGNIDSESVKRLITPQTKAIMAVDWGGLPCDYDMLRQIADKHDLKIIEDAAHAFGAEYKGQKVAAKYADFTCFSFQAIKHLTTGDGGLLVCKDEEDYIRGKTLRWFGIDRDAPTKDSRIDQDINEWGYKFHMNDINATIGIAQMENIETVLNDYRDNADFYDDNLPAMYKRGYFSKNKNLKSANWLYTVNLPNKILRDKFKDYMLSKDVEVNQVHRRNDHYSVFKPFARPLESTTVFANTMICIPVHNKVNEYERNYILDCMKKFATEYRGWA